MRTAYTQVPNSEIEAQSHLLYCKTSELSFDSLVKAAVLRRHHIIECSVGHEYIEVERCCRIVSRRYIVSSLSPSSTGILLTPKYITLAPVDLGLEHSPTKFHSFYVQNQYDITFDDSIILLPFWPATVCNVFSGYQRSGLAVVQCIQSSYGTN